MPVTNFSIWADFSCLAHSLPPLFICLPREISRFDRRQRPRIACLYDGLRLFIVSMLHVRCFRSGIIRQHLLFRITACFPCFGPMLDLKNTLMMLSDLQAAVYCLYVAYHYSCCFPSDTCIFILHLRRLLRMTHRKSAVHYWVRAVILTGFSFYIVYLIQDKTI